MTKPTLAGLCAGALAVASLTMVPGTAAGAVATPFEVTRSGDTYTAANTGTGASYTGSLVSVVEQAVADLNAGGGGRIQFTAGDFDLGTGWLDLHDIYDVEFAGAGMNQTTIRNSTDVAQDTEPFDFSGAFGVTVRDLTVSAGGAPRSTSDALDFDNGNDVVVSNVKVVASRGRGIVFDGKNDAWDSANNQIAGCEIDGVPSDGIELLASTDNVVEDCTITNVGGHGIQLAKASATADQPNKLPSRNTIRNNVIDESGQDGINVNGGNANLFVGNTITNSSDVTSSRDGIRLGTGDSMPCDDNQVRGNKATDTQATKTQRYGLAITSALCNRTVIGDDNDFTGNRVGPILDQGTGTVYEGTPPPVNHPPVAGDLSITAVVGAATTWTPAVSDPDPGTTLVCQLLEQPTQGTATVRTDCASGTYTASAGATGSDTFVYRVSDGNLADRGTVSVTITSTAPPNQPPVAGDVSITTSEGTAKTWTPVVSDPDAGSTLTCTITTPPANGTATVASNCSTGSYTPAAGKTGPDSFVYTVSDGKASDPGTVSVTVTPANKPPVAGDVSITTPEGTAKAWTPVVSDPDAGSTLTCTITTPPAKGTATVAPNCSTGSYTPAAGTTGADSFIYTVSDGKATDTGTVSVTVTPVNKAPVAGDVAVTTQEDTAKAWKPVVSDPDAGSTLTCAITTQPAHGSATVAPNCSTGSFTPGANKNGPVSFVYTVSDGTLTDTGTVSVTVSPVNDAPTAGAVEVVTEEDTPASWKPKASDVDGDKLTCTIASQPKVGVASVADDCSGGSYTPRPDVAGADSFSYTVSDGTTSATATVTVQVAATDDVHMLTPVADTFVKRSAPRSNFGSSAVLRADKDPRARSYVRFRVPGLAGDVLSVTLRVYVGASSEGGGMSVRGTGTAWRENRVTWNRSPEVGARLAMMTDGTPGAWHEISLPVTSVNGQGAVAWALTPHRGTDLRIRSDESTRAPELVIVTK